MQTWALAHSRSGVIQNESIPSSLGVARTAPGGDAEATPQFIATEKGDLEIVMELRGGGTVGRVYNL